MLRMTPRVTNPPLSPEASALPDAGLSRVFDDGWACFAVAARDGGGARKSLDLAGERVDLLFASDRLVPRFTRPITHLDTSRKAEPDLIIRVWDSVDDPGTAIPHPEARPDDEDGTINARFLASDERYIYCWQDSRALSMLDRSSSLALAWTPDADLLERHEIDAPFRNILSWWGGARGKPLMHAAAVGRDDVCVLLAGKGGSGKSTSALFCVEWGLRYLSDDFVMVDSTRDPPTVHSLYNTARLWRSDLYVDRLMGSTVDDAPPEEKGTGFMWELNPEAVVTSARAVAVVLPRVVGGKTRMRPASRADALKAIVPSTFLSLPGSSAGDVAAASRFLRSIPAYHLLLGDDVDQIPVLVDSLIDRHSA